MNRFVIVDGLPYLFAQGKTFRCRFDSEGFTVGAAVELAAVPAETVSELSVLAICPHPDSIGAAEKPAAKGRRKKAVNADDHAD